MTIEFTQRHEGVSKLLIIFAGWGMDARPFASLRRSGYDVAVVSDYRSTDLQLPEGYSEICVIAWSFGVPAAADFMRSHPELPVTLRIAVNGTLTPVDNLTGIPRAIFDGTLAGLTERSLAKFYRRMAGSTDAFAAFRRTLPQRDIAGLADELRAIDSRSADGRSAMIWDHIVISAADAIIPAANQQRAWEGHPSVTVTDGAHLIDFQQLVDRHLIDKALVRRRFADSMTTYAEEADVQRRMAATLAGLFRDSLRRQPRTLLEIGAGTGFLTRLIADLPDCDMTLWDLAPLDPSLPGRHVSCDAETEILSVTDGSVDAIVSAATIQWFNSPVEFIARCHRALSPGGVMAFSTFGPENFSELDSILGPSRYLSAAEWRRALSALGIRATVSDELIERHFPSAAALLRHLRLTGVNASESEPGRARRAARAIIRSQISRLTYHPVYIVIAK